MPDIYTLLTANEDWLLSRFQFHVADRGQERDGALLSDAWKNSLAEISRAIAEASKQQSNFSPGLPPGNPITAMATRQARRLRENGARLDVVLGLLKACRQSHLDLLREHSRQDKKAQQAIHFLQRCFDIFEIALCGEWTAAENTGNRAGQHPASHEQSREDRLYLDAVESIANPLILVDGKGLVRHLNKAAATSLQLPHTREMPRHEDDRPPPAGDAASADSVRPTAPQPMEGMHLSRVAPWLWEDMKNFLNGDSGTQHLERQVESYGMQYAYHISLSKIFDASESSQGAVAIFSDITEHARALEILRHNEQTLIRNRDLMQLVMDHTPALISYVDKELRYRFANAYYFEIFRVLPNEVLGKHLRDLIGEKVFKVVHPRYQLALMGQPQRFELPFTSPQGESHHFDVHYIPHRIAGEVQGVIALILDITQRKRAEQEQQRFFDVSIDMLCVTGLDGHFRKVNDAWTRGLGWTREELLGRSWTEFMAPDNSKKIQEAQQRLALGKSLVAFESRFRCKDGTYRWINWNAIPLVSEGLIYAVAHDTTRRREMEEVLKLLATKDSLTGANNRRQFIELAERELARATRYSRPVTLLMIDIDRFKRINDTHGHPAGDAALRKLVECIDSALRKTDSLGRLGGEEFAVLLPETEAQSGLQTAERIRSDVERLLIRYEELVINCTISIGLATTTEPKEPLNSLLKRADDALYEAKNAGRNCVRVAQCLP